MEAFLLLVVEYGPYVGLAVIIAGLVQALKRAFPVFFLKNAVGMRLLPFIPLVLGILGGLLLPQPTISSKILIGGALGTVSALIYKAITRTFASKAKLLAKAVGREE